ncbi:MAG: hypothetical protein LBC75_02660 [Fibromonadaceae bacterium]|jgi:hypothetical protein|nr:hypothetical protein [Fibromonadaceae bacterium]
MIDFNNQQIRNNLAPAFQSEQGSDYTGRIRDVKETSVAGYDIKPFEYADAELPLEAAKINAAGQVEPPKAFIEFFMQKYPPTQEYDFIKGQINYADRESKKDDYQIGQIVKAVDSNNPPVTHILQLVPGNEWKELGRLSGEKRLFPLMPSSIPIPEGTLCLCIKNSDKPIIAIPGRDDYDDTDYLFLYRENGRTYTQKKNHINNPFFYREKPAMYMEIQND